MSAFDSTIWIVHREPGPRAALGRLAGSARGRHQIVLGHPGDSVFDAATPADVVILDVTHSLQDPEPELDLARRVRRRNEGCAWILITEPAALELSLRLFDALDARVIAGPPDARTVQAAVVSALARTSVLPLSQRIGRDSLSSRFVRWFSSGEPRELALALDPRLSAEPVLARGETGTGRGLLLRYVHVTSTVDPGPFLRVACVGAKRPETLVTEIEDGLRETGNAAGRYGIWLDEFDRLPDAVQARVLDWIEFGPPAVLPSRLRGNVRWFASAGDDPTRLSVRAALAFAELTIRTVPLRERPQVIPAFVADTARAWAATRGESPKSFDATAVDLLRGEPWPGNLAELEAVVIRSLAHADPRARTLGVRDLRFGPEVEVEEPAGAAGPISEPEAAPEAEGGEPAPEPRPDLAAEPLPELAPAAPEPEPVVFLEPEPEPGREPALEDAELAEAEVLDLELPDLESVAPEPAGGRAPAAESLARLARAVAHEVRNPLVSIRTFSDLLEDNYEDPDFRQRFGRLVAEDVRRIEEVIERLERMGEGGKAPGQPLDMTALLEGLLDQQRGSIQAKRLLVLKELDRARPEAIGDEDALETALSGLLDRAIDEAPERGDLYLASRHRGDDPEHPTMRILIRYRVSESPSDSELALETLRSTNLQAEVAESIIERLGGSLRIDTANPAETLVVIDLPAPVAPR